MVVLLGERPEEVTDMRRALRARFSANRGTMRPYQHGEVFVTIVNIL
mgnify:FL=1